MERLRGDRSRWALGFERVVMGECFDGNCWI